MPRQEQIVERYWGVCWAWYVPYPCRKSRTVTKWCYDFSYLTVDYHYVYTNYVGCELNRLYRWRTWEPSLKGGAFTLYFVTKCYGSLRPDKGSCTPENAVVHLKQVLGADFDSVVRGEKQFGEAASPESGP